MLILPAAIPAASTAAGPISPINAAWLGAPSRPVLLPQYGHLLLLFPLANATISCASITVEAGRYLLLARFPEQGPLSVELLSPASRRATGAALLALWLSPPFVADMARFLGIPHDVRQLLDGVPLLQGDELSLILVELAGAVQHPAAPAIAEELFLEAAGELLRLMRLRHQALLALAHHRRNTVADLLPRLLQARQFVEARYTEPFKTQDVAAYVALSEFHFARLFSAAFDLTVRQYVIRLRLDEARRLLEQPGASVTETALHVGYSSLSSFIHAFSRRFGLSPARYQAQRENQQDLTSRSAGDAL